MAEVTVNGVRLHYEWHRPEDAPVLALLNGVLMSTRSWALQIPVLSRQYRLLLHDCRGQGQSEHPDGTYSMEQHAEDFRQLLDALRIEKAHVGGISYGAEIAMLFAARWPERVTTLFLSSAVSEVGAELRSKVESWIAAADCGDSDLLYRCSVADNYGYSFLKAHPNMAESALPRFRQLDLPAVSRLCRAFLDLNCTAELTRITAPTMVVVGEEDTLKPLRYARLIQAHIARSALLNIAGAGHAACIEQPHAWNSCWLGFLADQHARQAG
jgi:3-oxoadipate enol-lactonase